MPDSTKFLEKRDGVREVEVVGVPELQRSRKLQKIVSEREVERVQYQMRARKVLGWRGIGGKGRAERRRER